MTKILLSMFLAFVGYSFQYIATATQKIGLKIRETKKIKGTFTWISGLVGASVAIFIVMYAVSLGSVSIVGAMAGTGLVSLAVFSAIVMKEKIRRREMLGIFLILVAAALIGAFIQKSRPREILLWSLFLVMGIVICVYSTLWVVFRNHRIKGILIGVFAGTLGGFVPLFQKVATSELGRTSAFIPSLANQTASSSHLLARLGTVLLNPFSLLWIGISLGSTVIIQFAYKHDKAIRIIPAFSASYILVPVLMGVLSFKEILHPLQWLGVLLIIVGVLFVTVPRLIVHEREAD